MRTMDSQITITQRKLLSLSPEVRNQVCEVTSRNDPQECISGRGGGQILAVPFIKTFSKGFAGDGARNETSIRQRNTAIITKYTLPVTNVLLEHFAATFPMLTPTEMTMVVMQCGGQGLDLRCWSTRHTELGNGLFHHVNESGELGRFGLGNGSCCWCGGACVVKSKGKGRGTVQYKSCGVVDLLQCIQIIGEMVGELELELVGDLGPKLLWEAAGKGLALFCGRDMIFCDQKSGHSDKHPVVLSQIGE